MLRGKRCVVTGASRGIGKAIAAMLSAEGAQVHGGGRAECDVSDEASIKNYFAADKFSQGLDLLVLNAGVLERGPIEEFTASKFDRVISVNLRGAFLCAREAWPHLAKSGGRIVAIGSISGTLGTPNAAAYNASKWGLTGLMKSLAEEGRAKKLFCATVLPSGVDTEMLKQTPFTAAVKADEVARVVKFLADEAPFAMTGSAVEVFG